MQLNKWIIFFLSTLISAHTYALPALRCADLENTCWMHFIDSPIDDVIQLGVKDRGIWIEACGRSSGPYDSKTMCTENPNGSLTLKYASSRGPIIFTLESAGSYLNIASSSYDGTGCSSNVAKGLLAQTPLRHCNFF